MCTYLAKRGATYYFRRPIPAQLRPAMGGRTEFMVSLRTKDREAAKRLIPSHTVASDTEMEQARMRIGRRAAMETAEEPNRVTTAVGPGISEGELEAAELAYQDALEQEARREAREDEHRYWRKRLRFTTREMTAREAAVKDMLADKDFDLEIAKNEIRHLRSLLGQAKSVHDPELLVKGVPAALPETVAQSDSGAMLDTTIIQGWSAERRPAKKTVDAHRAVARWFYERVGRKPVASITRADALNFKAKLVEEGTTAANIAVKLSRLRTLLQWAFDNGHAASNAAAGVTIKNTVRPRDKRLEFDLSALTAIFGSPVFTEGARPTQGRGEAAYWIPLLALFTGARMGELAQLRPSDVQERTYPDAKGADQVATFILVREDEDDGLKLKNAGSERLIPVHPELERLGFLRFVAAVKAAGAPRLFHQLKAGAYGKLSAKWGEWFSKYLRTVCGVTDRRMVFHSFRHTFKQYARHAGIIEGVQRQLMGHSPGDTADEYGSGYPIHQLVEGMRQYRVPGLKLP